VQQLKTRIVFLERIATYFTKVSSHSTKICRKAVERRMLPVSFLRSDAVWKQIEVGSSAWLLGIQAVDFTYDYECAGFYSVDNGSLHHSPSAQIKARAIRPRLGIRTPQHGGCFLLYCFQYLHASCDMETCSRRLNGHP
jgi:hypothetical protein